MNALALFMALIIAFRCVRVIYHMDYKRRGVPYWRWLGFGVSYAVLSIAALGSALHILQGQGMPGDWLWLIASAGLISFDRRARRHAGVAMPTSKEKQCSTES